MTWRTRDVDHRVDAERVAHRIGAVSLDDPVARQPAVVGAKAAALAVARANGLPVVDGIVVTAGADGGALVRSVWASLTHDGRSPIAVRSSSAIEDQAASSMAGQFVTVLDVSDQDEARRAIARVRASSEGPMAVLLQPMVDASLGGVVFGVDPVSGRRDRIVVEVVRGNPSALVGGAAVASRHVLTRRGRNSESAGQIVLPRRDRRRLARLARDAARVFGAPQDIEWAIDRDGTLWLLQSRPITAISAEAQGPRFGPGPIAETFPDALAPLELDLWMEPLRAGIAEALHLSAVQPARSIERSPVLVEIGGRVAADLDLLEGRPRSRVARLLDPRPAARRVAASWQVGRLRRALPSLAGDVVRNVDADLAAVPRPGTLDETSLLGLLGRCRVALRAVHGHEVLAGLLGSDDDGTTGAALALRAVAAGRSAGLDDGEIVARTPVALTLCAPRIGAHPRLPPVGDVDLGAAGPLAVREALRLRARLLHELSARTAVALGERLAAAGLLDDSLVVRWLTLDELATIVRHRSNAPPTVYIRMAVDDARPLPTAFRFATDGSIVAHLASGEAAGRGAGGGRGVGVVATVDDATPGTVLVVRHLEPGLAAVLPGRSGLVAETGSVLSHLAIVARELGVPTVVGVPGAVERFAPGTRIVVDGRTGEVSIA